MTAMVALAMLSMTVVNALSVEEITKIYQSYDTEPDEEPDCQDE